MTALRDKLTYANVMATIAVFIAIGGATALAVDGPNPGQNTIGSEDIIGNEVKSDDIGNGRIFNLDIADEIITGAKLKNGTVTGDDVDESTLAPAEGWTTVAPNPQVQADPCDSGQTAIFCGNFEDLFGGWANYGSGFATAAFYKDRDSVVHLRGLVNPSSFSDDFPTPATIFKLPVAYRPNSTRLFATLCYDGISGQCRVDITSGGDVRWVTQGGDTIPNHYLSLEGISFRVP